MGRKRGRGGAGFEAFDDGVQGGDFAAAFDDPDVVLAEFTAGALAVLVAALISQGFGGRELLAQLGQVGGVGDEVPAGRQACVAFVAAFSGGSRQTPLGSTRSVRWAS